MCIRDRTRRVVVTGLGAVTPLGNDVKTTWENMKKGVNGIDTVTKFDASDYKCSLAGEVRGFDPTLYIPRGEVRRTDLFTQYAIAAATQAYDDSGMTAESIAPERFGVYIGSGIGGVSTLIEEHLKMIEKGPGRVSPFFVPMMISNMASGMVAIKYNAQGPNIAVVTACATSTNSLGEAYRAIKHGYADAMLAGGSEAAILPLCFAGFISCQALSQSTDKDRASIPFDKERGGFIMGEGGAVLMLEEYETAKKRGARIYAEVVGYGCTNDAYHMTAPNPEAVASARAIELAAKDVYKRQAHQRRRHRGVGEGLIPLRTKDSCAARAPRKNTSKSEIIKEIQVMETLEKLKEILAECKGEDIDVTPETTFDELNFDSLDKVDIVMQIEDAYGITLGDNLQLSTVGELIQKIDEAVAAK